MIAFHDPETGNIRLCNSAEIVPDGVPWREVPSYEGREHRDALIDFDAEGNPVFDNAAINKKLIAQEATSRMNALFDTIETIDDMKFFASFWKSITPAARQATPELQQVIDIYTTAKQAIANNTPFDQIVWP